MVHGLINTSQSGTYYTRIRIELGNSAAGGLSLIAARTWRAASRSRGGSPGLAAERGRPARKVCTFPTFSRPLRPFAFAEGAFLICEKRAGRPRSAPTRHRRKAGPRFFGRRLMRRTLSFGKKIYITDPDEGSTTQGPSFPESKASEAANAQGATCRRRDPEKLGFVVAPPCIGSGGPGILSPGLAWGGALGR
jgi:hypothetical protein